LKKSEAILVIRPDGKFSAVLREEGFEVTDLELVRTEPLDDLAGAELVLAGVDNYDGLFFTSPVAAEVFVRSMRSRGYAGKIYVLGERAKAIFQAASLPITHDAEISTAAQLINKFGHAEFAGKRFLYVRGDKSLRTIPNTLSGIADVDELVVYRTRDTDPAADVIEAVRAKLRGSEIGWACFFSPSGVERFAALFDARNHLKAAVIGETTAAKAAEAGLSVGLI
jgi:uroporphyrinogen-III synthase